MTPRTCPRCHSPLHLEDANSLVYCWHCGAPQVTLSEDLQDQFAQQQLAIQQAGDAPLPPAAVIDATNVLWSRVLQLVGLAGAVVVVLSIVMAVFPPLGLLAFFWAVGAPIILLGIYCARTPLTRVTTGFGARLGLLSGLSIAIAGVTMQTVGILLKRFVFHQGAQLDAGLNTVFATLQTQMLAQSTGQADIDTMQPIIHWLTIPEFRIGFMMAGGLVFVGLYLLYASLAGAFAGFLRSRASVR